MPAQRSPESLDGDRQGRALHACIPSDQQGCCRVLERDAAPRCGRWAGRCLARVQGGSGLLSPFSVLLRTRRGLSRCLRPAGLQLNRLHPRHGDPQHRQGAVRVQHLLQQPCLQHALDHRIASGSRQASRRLGWSHRVSGSRGEDLRLSRGERLRHRQVPGADPIIGSYNPAPCRGAVRGTLRLRSAVSTLRPGLGSSQAQSPVGSRRADRARGAAAVRATRGGAGGALCLPLGADQGAQPGAGDDLGPAEPHGRLDGKR